MKKILLAVIAMALTGCGIDYDGRTKIIFEGRVVDDSGNPIPNLRVRASISDSNETDYIGIDKTDSNGRYRMMFPGASEPVDFALHVNYDDYNDPEAPAWSQTTVFNIPQEQVEDRDYLINFGETALYPVANSVNLHIDYVYNGSEGAYPDAAMLTGLVNNQRIDYNFERTVELGYGEGYYDNNFQVAKNQVLTLYYTFQDGIIHQVQIPVGEENLTYTLEL